MRHKDRKVLEFILLRGQNEKILISVRGHESRTGRRRGVMPCRRHGAAREELRGKVRGGEDVRWRACVAVWGAK
jgi:hypothetical protein